MKHLSEQSLSHYLDGALAAADRQSVDTHVAECNACRAQLAMMRSIDRAVKTQSRVEPPFDFTARVMQHVAPVQNVRESLGLFRNIPALMLSSLMAVVVGVALFGAGSSPGHVPAGGITHSGTQAFVGTVDQFARSLIGIATGPTGALFIAVALLVLMGGFVDRAARRSV